MPLYVYRKSVVLLAMAVCLGAGAFAQAPEADLQLIRNQVFLPVTINGVGPYPFLLDTDALYSAVDKSVADYLGLPAMADPEVSAKKGGQTLTAQLVQAAGFDLAGQPLMPLPLLSTDLSGLAPVYGMRVAGILSGAQLPGGFTINLMDQVFVWDDGEAVPRDPYAVALRLADGSLVLNAVVNGRHVRACVLDTSFAGVIEIPEKAAEEMVLFTKDTPQLTLTSGGGKTAGENWRQIRLATLQVGVIEMRQPVADIVKRDGRPRLGIGYFKHFETTFNLQAGYLRLRPNGPLPVIAGPIEGYGISPAELEDGYWSVDVARNSPAAKGGLRPGDKIAAIDGKSAEFLSYQEIAQRLEAAAGTARDFAYIRKGKRTKVTLKADKLL